MRRIAYRLLSLVNLVIAVLLAARGDIPLSLCAMMVSAIYGSL